MFPTAESAFLDWRAAVTDANVSGREVPRATIVIAVTDWGIMKQHPIRLANSPTMSVTRPIQMRAPVNAAHPLQYFGGGIVAKTSFQPIAQKWKKASSPSISSMSPSSESRLGPRIRAFLNCPAQDYSCWSRRKLSILNSASCCSSTSSLSGTIST